MRINICSCRQTEFMRCGCIINFYWIIENKEIGVKEVVIGDKLLIEAVV